jgi:hypothetical protein
MSEPGAFPRRASLRTEEHDGAPDERTLAQVAMKLTNWLHHYYDRSKVSKWRRHHYDGSEGVVEERKTGAFIAVDLLPLAYGLRGGVHRECTTLEDAFLEVDYAAERRGHTCTSACTLWRRD